MCFENANINGSQIQRLIWSHCAYEQLRWVMQWCRPLKIHCQRIYHTNANVFFICRQNNTFMWLVLLYFCKWNLNLSTVRDMHAMSNRSIDCPRWAETKTSKVAVPSVKSYKERYSTNGCFLNILRTIFTSQIELYLGKVGRFRAIPFMNLITNEWEPMGSLSVTPKNDDNALLAVLMALCQSLLIQSAQKI